MAKLRIAVAFLAFCFSQFQVALAAESIVADATKLDLTLGVAYTTDAKFRGVLVQPKWQPAVEIAYERGPLFASTDHGIGLKIREEGTFAAGLGANYQSGRSEKEDHRYRGLGNVAGSIEAHAFFEWLPFGPALTLYGDVGSGLSGARGTLYSAGARLGFPLMSNLSGFFDSSFTGANERYVRAFYGVSAEQAVASGYKAYMPRAGIYEIASVIGASYDVTPKWSLIVSFGTTRRLGSVAASPLIDHRSYPVGLVVSSYHF